MRQAVLALLLDRQHLHGNVTRGGVELEVVQHRPPQHVGEEHVERDGRRTVFAGQRQRLHPARGHQTFEPLAARDPEEDARVVRIVFHDEQRGVPRLDVVAIV